MTLSKRHIDEQNLNFYLRIIIAKNFKLIVWYESFKLGIILVNIIIWFEKFDPIQIC